MLSTTALFLSACHQDVGSLGNAHTGGERDASVGDGGPPAGMGCTLTHGFWKTHEDDWPVTSLTLGGRTYDQAALLALLRAPSHGDASIILAKQLIAAKLNVAAGASSIDAIAEADAFIDAHDDSQALPLGIHPSSAAGQEAVQIAGELTAYNEGRTGPGHCPDDRPPQPCEAGLTNCGGVCVDTGSDESHCGDCDNVCLPGKMCIYGECVLPPADAGAPMDAGMPGIDAGMPGIDAGMPGIDAGMPGIDAGPPPVDAGPPPMDAGPPPMDAGPPPVDAGPPPVDAGPPDAGQDAGPPPSCGAGGACGPNSTCNAGVCVCNNPWIDCDGVESNGCEVHYTTDNDNCQVCGRACAEGQVCWGDCMDDCPSPYVECDNTCKDFQSDPTACNGCGNACPEGNTCQYYVCQPCPWGLLDCDGLPGCEASGTHRGSCGRCDFTCPNPATYCDLETGFNPGCGQCGAGTADCNGAAEDFCEVTLATDESDCGACGNACAVGLTCVNGNCV